MARTDRATALIIEGASKQKSLTAKQALTPSGPHHQPPHVPTQKQKRKHQRRSTQTNTPRGACCVAESPNLTAPPHPPPAPLCITAAHPLQAPGTWPDHFLAAVATASFLSFASSFCFLLGVMPDFFVPSRVSAAAAATAAAAAPGVAAGGGRVNNLCPTQSHDSCSCQGGLRLHVPQEPAWVCVCAGYAGCFDQLAVLCVAANNAGGKHAVALTSLHAGAGGALW